MFYQGRLFQQIVLSMLVIIVFAAFSLVLTDYFFRNDRRRFFEAPAQAMAKKISETKQDPETFVKQFNEVTEFALPFNLKVISQKEAEDFGTPPEGTFDVITYDDPSLGNTRVTLAKLDSTEPRYLEVIPKHPENGRRNHFFTMLFSLIVSAVLAMVLSLAYLFTSLKSRNTLAEGIIGEIKRGNLKARFPIDGKLSQTMVSFNKMADEIEGLVDRLKQTEQARMVLLQQLAHDLRTPIASLKNLLETAHTAGSKLDQATRDDILGLSLKEATYFERLVEDLLFLAQVSEPKYTVEKQQVSLTGLLEEQMGILERKYPAVKMEKIGFDGDQDYLGDRKLLERLFRNSLENALSFAKSICRIQITPRGQGYDVTVFNNGPQMTPQEISSFGQRKTTRLLNKSKDGRVSVGLGSVIMETIARAHGGRAVIANVDDGVALQIHLSA